MASKQKKQNVQPQPVIAPAAEAAQAAPVAEAAPVQAAQAAPVQAPKGIDWRPIIDRAVSVPQDARESVLKRYAAAVLLDDQALTQAELDQGMALVTAAVQAAVRNAALDRLKVALASYTMPDSLVALVKQAQEAGVSLTFGSDTKLCLVQAQAVRSQAASTGQRGRPATFASVAQKGGADGMLFDGQPVTSTMLRTDPRLKGAEAYLNRGSAGRTMDNGVTYSAGSNMNAGQALRSWLKGAGPLQEAARKLTTQGT